MQCVLAYSFHVNPERNILNSTNNVTQRNRKNFNNKIGCALRGHKHSKLQTINLIKT